MSERAETRAQKDLYALWRQLYDANEKVWSQATSDFMETDAFAQWQGRMLETFLAFQRTWKDSATAQLEAANIPTRDDIARLGELILALEEKIDQLADRIGAGVAPGMSSTVPTGARTGRSRASAARSGTRRTARKPR